MDIIILKNAVHSHTGLFRIMKFHFKCSRGGTKSSRGGECPPLPPPKKNPAMLIYLNFPDNSAVKGFKPGI